MIHLDRYLLLAVTPNGAAYQAGYFTGQLMALLLLAWPAARCFLALRRPEVNPRCALSLGIFLSGLLVAAIMSAAIHLFPALTFLSVIGAIVLLGAVPAGLVLAIIGLVECADKKERFPRGRGYAICTLVFVFLCLCAAAVGIVAAARKNRAFTSAAQPAPGQWLTFEDYNFKLRAPAKPWVQMDSRKINKDANVAFMQAQPPVWFMVIAEKIGAGSSLNTEGLADLTKSNLRSRAE